MKKYHTGVYLATRQRRHHDVVQAPPVFSNMYLAIDTQTLEYVWVINAPRFLFKYQGENHD